MDLLELEKLLVIEQENFHAKVSSSAEGISLDEILSHSQIDHNYHWQRMWMKGNEVHLELKGTENLAVISYPEGLVLYNTWPKFDIREFKGAEVEKAYILFSNQLAEILAREFPF